MQVDRNFAFFPSNNNKKPTEFIQIVSKQISLIFFFVWFIFVVVVVFFFIFNVILLFVHKRKSCLILNALNHTHTHKKKRKETKSVLNSKQAARSFLIVSNCLQKCFFPKSILCIYSPYSLNYAYRISSSIDLAKKKKQKFKQCSARFYSTNTFHT